MNIFKEKESHLFGRSIIYIEDAEKCEIYQKAEIMYLIVEVIHVSEKRYRIRKLCANCLIINCGDTEAFRELFPFDE